MCSATRRASLECSQRTLASFNADLEARTSEEPTIVTTTVNAAGRCS
jgi:hypothetical protein